VQQRHGANNVRPGGANEAQEKEKSIGIKRQFAGDHVSIYGPSPDPKQNHRQQEPANSRRY